MKRFTDIKQEICEPVVHFTPDCPCCSQPEAFLRLYRNFWGAYSDTQIRYLDEQLSVAGSGDLGQGFIITGRYCNVPNYFFELFMNKVIGHNLVVPMPMVDILKNLKMCAEYVMYNGQVAILSRNMSAEEQLQAETQESCTTYVKLTQEYLTEKQIRIFQ
jgi:hypothetical protein